MSNVMYNVIIFSYLFMYLKVIEKCGKEQMIQIMFFPSELLSFKN